MKSNTEEFGTLIYECLRCSTVLVAEHSSTLSSIRSGVGVLPFHECYPGKFGLTQAIGFDATTH